MADAYLQHLTRGGELLRADRVEEARVELEAARALKPQDGKLLSLLGLVHFRLGQFDDAKSIYSDLVQRQPADASLQLNLGLVHLKLGSADEAVQALATARRLDPSQPRTIGYLGLAYARAGRYAEARDAFRQAGQDELAREMEQHLAAGAPATPPPPPPEAFTAGATSATSTSTSTVTPAPTAAPAAAPADDSPASSAPPPTPSEAVAATSGSPAPSLVPPAAQPVAPPRAMTKRGLGDELPFSEATGAAFAASPGAYAASVGLSSSPGPSSAAFPAADGAAPASDGPPNRQESIVSTAVRLAAPQATMAQLVGEGHRPPQPVASFATARLLRPDEGELPLELGVGGLLIVRVRGRIYSRTEGVIVSGGELAYEPASKRERGRQSEQPFGSDGRPVFIISGHGHVVAAPRGGVFTALELVDDALYLREDLVYAFEERLRWENGHVPGSDDRLPVVQLRGEGCVALRTARPPITVKVTPERGLYVDASLLAGWLGRVVPRVVAPAAGGDASTPFIECSGEGMVIVEEPGALADEPAPASTGA